VYAALPLIGAALAFILYGAALERLLRRFRDRLPVVQRWKVRPPAA
jgi:hypothetical protein